MSLPVGIGDIIATVDLANRVRQNWVDAPEEYESIRNETKILASILQDIHNLESRVDLSPQQNDDLKQAAHNCSIILKQLEQLVERYSSLQPDSSPRQRGVRRIWERFRLNPNDIRHLRDRLVSSMALLSTIKQNIETNIVFDVREGVQELSNDEEERERHAIAHWFASASFAGHHSDNFAQRHDDTGTWLLTHPQYRSWCETPNQTLFCPGIPGSGKTIMVATVIHDLRLRFEGDPNVVVVYIYCKFNRQDEQTLHQMLASLVRQLFQEQPRVPHPVRQVYQRHRDQQTRPSIDELKSLLRRLVCDYGRVFAIVDALDECANPHRNNLLDELFILHEQVRKNVNIFSTARHIPDIERRFVNCSTIEIRAHDDDMKSYLQTRVKDLASCVKRDRHLQEKITTQIAQLADGMFLLARLHIESLADKTTPRKIYNALGQLQKGNEGLSTAYEHALTRIDHQLPGYRDLARQVLSWVTYAKRELSIEEVQEAIAIEEGMQLGDLKDNLEDPDEMVSVCAGLIMVDTESHIVRLVHLTTQEYLRQVLQTWIPDAPAMITRKCLAYLSMDTLTSGRCTSTSDFQQTFSSHKFFDYAAKYWGFHASKCDHKEVDEEVLEFLHGATHYDFLGCSIFATAGLSESYGGPRDISRLHICAHFNMPGILGELLAQGHVADPRDSWMRTPLSWAAKKGYVRVVELLLAHPDVEADSRDDDGQTPLSRAAEKGRTKTVKLLLARSDVEADSKSGRGWTPLSFAAANGYVDVVKLLLTRPDVKVDWGNGNGQTPLSLAAENGHTEVVKLLLARPDVYADSKDVRQQTPLLLAAKYGYTEIVTLLLARPEVKADSKDDQSETPLSLATKKGHTQIVKLLLARSDVDHGSKDHKGRTLLSWAAERGHTGAVELYLALGDVEADSKDCNGQTPLSWAAERGHMDIVRLLLSRQDVEDDSKDRNGRTPLFWAAMRGEIQLVQLLLSRSAQSDPKDKYGRTPLSRAAASGQTKILQLFLDHQDVEADSKDDDGRTPLSWAAEMGHTEVVTLLLKEPRVEADSKDCKNRTPLSWAARNGHTEVVRLLLEQQPRVNSKDLYWRTPLSHAAEGGHTEVVRLLLDEPQVEADSKDDFDTPPLSFAAANGHIAVAELLLACEDVKADLKYFYYRSPLQRAIAAGHTEMVKLLLSQPHVKSEGALRYAKQRQNMQIISLIKQHIEQHSIITASVEAGSNRRNR